MHLEHERREPEHGKDSEKEDAFAGDERRPFPSQCDNPSQQDDGDNPRVADLPVFKDRVGRAAVDDAERRRPNEFECIKREGIECHERPSPRRGVGHVRRRLHPRPMIMNGIVSSSSGRTLAQTFFVERRSRK